MKIIILYNLIIKQGKYLMIYIYNEKHLFMD